MKDEKFRVMRVLVYEGGYEFIQRSLQGSVPANGERKFSDDFKIKSSIVGGMPDLMVDDWEVKNEIEKDDFVFVIDNSETLEVGEKGIEYEKVSIPGGVHDVVSPIFKVIHTGKNILPAKQDWMIYDKKRYNNTIIENIYNGKTYLIKKEYLLKLHSKESEEYINRKLDTKNEW